MKARSFTCFPRLPPELRRLIWKHASFHSRNVDITASYHPTKLSDTWDLVSPEEIFYYLSVCPPPSILSVSRESRSEALKYYTLDFGVKPTSSPPENAVKPHIWINWEVDRIVLVNWGMLKYFLMTGHDFKEKCTRNKLRLLVLNLHGWAMKQHVLDILPAGLALEELGFGVFCGKEGIYEKPMVEMVRLEERRMVQAGAYQEIVDAVSAEWERREERTLAEKASGGESGVSLNPLAVKLVRLV